MSKDNSKPSAIERLLALFSQPTHDYRPATEIFLDLNVGRIADNANAARKTDHLRMLRRPMMWSIRL
jgi:hypothetical protein